MWHLTACKISVSLSCFKWIKTKMIFFYRISVRINVGNINSEIR